MKNRRFQECLRSGRGFPSRTDGSIHNSSFIIHNSLRGFTLIEMLIVVVVLVTLMSITFRLMNIGTASDARVTTVMRLQKLENCLSGYYAAFGSYPPVKLQGSQDYNFAVSGHGIQSDTRNEISWGSGAQAQYDAWQQVKAACMAQPVAARYPFPDGYSGVVSGISDEIKERISAGDEDYKGLSSDRLSVLNQGFDNISDNPGRFGGRDKTEMDWREIQIFQFGLMSYLLPRYMFMMNGPVHFFQGEGVAQWSGNNTLPSDPFMGELYQSWNDVKTDSEKDADDDGFMKIANIPSQTACARWMPNLENLCKCNHNYRFFGIYIRNRGAIYASPNIEIFSPTKGAQTGTSGQYLLDTITVEDGWFRDFYYYSPPPYQTYILWSAGPNGKTFPPWVSRNDIDNSTAKEIISSWTADDIIHMSN